MIDNYEQRLIHVKDLETSLKDSDLKGEKNLSTFRKWANLQYQRMKSDQQGWEVQSIYEGDMNKSPMIEFLDEKGKELEKALKQKESDAKQFVKDFAKEFKTSMENLAKNEPDFAMYINSNINALREQFLDSQS